MGPGGAASAPFGQLRICDTQHGEVMGNSHVPSSIGLPVPVTQGCPPTRSNGRGRYRGKGVKVIKALTRQSDLKRAMDLARAISEYLQYSPEPFVDLHYEATGESGPYLY